MWIGAHPGSPSLVGSEDGQPLHDLIAEDPARALGSEVVSRLGQRLPFMMKLLAASEPLSLQVHPSQERARRRFAEQEAAAIARDARARSYPDPSHKPELLFALTRLEGMAGFRDVESSAAILRGLQLGWLDDVARDLEGDPRPPSALRSVVTRWLALPAADTRVRLEELREAAIGAEARAHRAARLHRPAPVDAAHVSRESVRVYAATVPLIDRYPDDPGVLVTLLLNHLVLAPGEAMFVDAGIVHAYTSGFGVEIMATSDNVLRAGLTPKHVDILELLEVADFRPIPPPRQHAARTGRVLRLTPPVDEFELCLIEPEGEPVLLEHVAPRMAVCLGGRVELSDDQGVVSLDGGEAVFIDAAGGPLRITGVGRVAVGQTPAQHTEETHAAAG
jgi:mannose-6-phosphate isomerase